MDLLSKINRSEVVTVARDLVAIPSITTQEGLGMVEYYDRWFRDLGIETESCPYDEQRANFFAAFGGDGSSARYMFNGHQDVKPVAGMTVEPFSAEVRDGRLYGRGACDMKGPIAALLCAIRALVRADILPKARVVFFSDIEEEYGGRGGIDWAKENGRFDGYDGLFSCEPSELVIQIGNRGSYTTAFEVTGKSAHSGLAERGVNAVHAMARFIDAFLELPYLGVADPVFGKPTANFERIEGGLYLATVPDRCVACVDSRLVPSTPPDLVQQQVDGLMARLRKEHGIEVREVAEPPGWRARPAKRRAESIPPDHPLVRRLQRAGAEATGSAPEVGGFPAMAIGGVTIPLGLPTVIFGPGSIAQAHTDDEWINVEELEAAARIYACLLAGL